LGRATKIAQFIADEDKTYEVEINLGQVSTTFDSEGIIDVKKPVPDLTETDMQKILNGFKGVTRQKVPAYSAVKINGKRLYELARKGIKTETPEREIIIDEIELKKIELPRISFIVSCSKGTYVRTLANDIGEKIGCGAYMSKLRRTRVGDYVIDDALTLKEIMYYRQAGMLKRYIKPIETVLPFPSVQVNREFSPSILSGRPPRLKDIVDIDREFSEEEYISLRDFEGRIMAIGKADIDSSRLDNTENKNFFTYVRVLN